MSKKKTYLLDCGSNVGQSTKYFIENLIVDKDTSIHLFEPNEVSIQLSKKNLEKYIDYDITYHQVAVWIENCKRNLTVEYSPADYQCQLNSNDIIIGKNNAGGATNIMEGLWKKPSYIADEYITSGGMVDCIDFSEFIKNNIDAESKIICKMDIEGAEYEVLGKLIDDNTIDLIDKIYVEWHNHLLVENYDTSMFINEMQSRNVKVERWI